MVMMGALLQNSRLHFDDANKIHEPHHIKCWIQFKPFAGEVWIFSILMVIVLKQFTQ
jgi:hypothetical protein